MPEPENKAGPDDVTAIHMEAELTGTHAVFAIPFKIKTEPGTPVADVEKLAADVGKRITVMLRDPEFEAVDVCNAGPQTILALTKSLEGAYAVHQALVENRARDN